MVVLRRVPDPLFSMSFGWSAGDVVAAIGLVNRIIKSVGNVGGAREHFQELETELLSLSRALREISALASEPGQIPEIAVLKFVACLCEDTLKRFYDKIKPFDTTLSIGADSDVRRTKTIPKMVRWELLIKKEIPELRSYLVVHVGSLNLRLNTALLKITSKSLVNTIQKSASLQDQLHTETLSICEKINSISHLYVGFSAIIDFERRSAQSPSSGFGFRQKRNEQLVYGPCSNKRRRRSLGSFSQFCSRWRKPTRDLSKTVDFEKDSIESEIFVNPEISVLLESLDLDASKEGSLRSNTAVYVSKTQGTS